MTVNIPTTSSKQRETEKRRAEVERYLVRKFSVQDIAQILKVSSRTVDRDIYEIRNKNLALFQTSLQLRTWVRKQWSDAISSLNEAERMFWQFSTSAKSEATKARCVWYVVQTIEIRNQILDSIGFSSIPLSGVADNLYQPNEADLHADGR